MAPATFGENLLSQGVAKLRYQPGVGGADSASETLAVHLQEP